MADLQVLEQVRAVLVAVLGNAAAPLVRDRNSPLLGTIAELDSIAVVTVLTAFEDRFGLSIDDDEIDGSTFATLGSLADFVEQKLSS